MVWANSMSESESSSSSGIGNEEGYEDENG